MVMTCSRSVVEIEDSIPRGKKAVQQILVEMGRGEFDIGETLKDKKGLIDSGHLAQETPSLKDSLKPTDSGRAAQELMAELNDPCACAAMPNRVDPKAEETSVGCIEFCSYEASMLSEVLSKCGKLRIRLTPEFMDCANNLLVDCLIEQLKT